jgi:hypothetical protein
MKSLLLLTAILLLSIGLLSACAIVVTPSGPELTRDYSLSDFSNINISGPFDARIVKSDNFKVSVTANENLYKYVDISKSGTTLNIKTKPLSLIGTHVLVANITMPELGNLSVSGGANTSATGFSNSNKTEIKTSGGASLNMDLVTGDVIIEASAGSTIKGKLKSSNTRISVSAGSQVNISGTGTDCAITLSAGSQTDLSDFHVSSADVHLSAGSRAEIAVSDRLDIRVSDGSTLIYSGNPVIGNIENSGGSTIKHNQ